MARSALVVALTTIGILLILAGVIVGVLGVLATTHQLGGGSAEMFLAGVGCLWAAAMLFSQLGAELRQIATFRGDVAAAQSARITTNISAASDPGAVRCRDCGSPNERGAERCQLCRRFLR